MGSSLRQPLLTADIFTSRHRLSASIPIYNRRLGDILNDRLTDFLQVRNVYVSRINRPGDIVGTYKLASLIKKQINFVVLPTEADGLSQEHKYNAFSKSAEDVFMTLPSFEVIGRLEIIGKFDLKALLAIGTSKFMPIFQGKAINALNPEVNFSGPVILVNKEALELFSVIRHG
jgi:hypothetical protein